jgi:hypothetical protein
MKALKQLIILSAVACIAVACTASVRVMPGPNDVNRVVARDIEKYGAEKAAVRAAVNYCEDLGQQAVFLSDSIRYEGLMDEAERNDIRRQAEAATIMGGILRSNHDDDLAVVFESVGATGSSMTSGKDYTAQVTFRCMLS